MVDTSAPSSAADRLAAVLLAAEAVRDSVLKTSTRGPKFPPLAELWRFTVQPEKEDPGAPRMGLLMALPTGEEDAALEVVVKRTADLLCRRLGRKVDVVLLRRQRLTTCPSYISPPTEWEVDWEGGFVLLARDVTASAEGFLRIASKADAYATEILLKGLEKELKLGPPLPFSRFPQMARSGKKGKRRPW